MELKQIYDISGLKLKFGSKKALEINTLKFHNGLIYGVCCLLYTSPSPRD